MCLTNADDCIPLNVQSFDLNEKSMVIYKVMVKGNVPMAGGLSSSSAMVIASALVVSGWNRVNFKCLECRSLV